MPRKNNRRDDAPPLDPERVRQGAAALVAAPDGEWFVRTVTAAGAMKTYRCPGCDHEINPGTPHVVAWPREGSGVPGIDERRHWHTACWSARSRRRR